jgi:hypothetical protein
MKGEERVEQLIKQLGFELGLVQLENETDDSYVKRIKEYSLEHREETEQAIRKVSNRKVFYPPTDKEKEETKNTFLHMLVKVAFGVMRV